jgi:DNA-directed RNA polymerase specialized sigma24 family protein
MKLFEPSRAWQEQVHQRILENEVTAFAELCEYTLPYLVSYLQAGFPDCEASLHETTAIDCLLAYRARAKQYDPTQISLFAYLRMAARRDMLNAIDKKTRHEKRLTSIHDAAIQSQLPTQDPLQEQREVDEWLQERTDLTLAQILKMLDKELDEYEKRVLLLMLEGVKDTQRFIEVLPIQDLDDASQRKVVKQAKDRLVKKLRRFGKRVNTK